MCSPARAEGYDTLRSKLPATRTVEEVGIMIAAERLGRLGINHATAQSRRLLGPRISEAKGGIVGESDFAKASEKGEEHAPTRARAYFEAKRQCGLLGPGRLRVQARPWSERGRPVAGSAASPPDTVLPAHAGLRPPFTEEEWVHSVRSWGFRPADWRPAASPCGDRPGGGVRKAANRRSQDRGLTRERASAGRALPARARSALPPGRRWVEGHG